MADGMTVRVELMSGRGNHFDPPPARVFLVDVNNTFGELAHVINLHFARWDPGHLHLFRLGDGREIGPSDPDFPEWLDDNRVTLSSVLTKGDEFEYVFDFGDDWQHHCRVEEVGVDLSEAVGEATKLPVPISGWGSMPDQYGRQSETGTEEYFLR
jgi:Plasmid pRiA4b ORF-3-like protein